MLIAFFFSSYNYTYVLQLRCTIYTVWITYYRAWIVHCRVELHSVVHNYANELYYTQYGLHTTEHGLCIAE